MKPEPLLQEEALQTDQRANGRLHLAIFTSIALVLLSAPLFVYPIFVMNVLILAIYASSFALLLGAGGLLSFGQAAYFGTSAYVCGYVAREYGLPPEVAILCGAACGAVLGLVFGFLAIRRQGIYFAMVTLALAQMVYFICLRIPATGGENGLQRVPRGHLFGLIDLRSDIAMYYFVVVVFMGVSLFIHRVIHSPFGEILRAIRNNETRVASLGYKVFRYKLVLYVIATTLAGIAGSMKVISFQLATLTDVYWTTSGDAVQMTLIGGIGTIFGPLAGAFVLVTLQTYLAHFGSWVTVVQGVVFVLCVMLFREGIVGRISLFIRRPL